MQNETTFERFRSGLATDRRLRRLVERGLLLADFSSKSPEGAVLLLAVPLADAEDRARAMDRNRVLDPRAGVAIETCGIQLHGSTNRTV